MRLKKKKNKVSIEKRLRWVSLGFCLVAFILMIRAASIQVIGDQRLKSLASRQFSSQVKVRPRRGIVYDWNGEALAVNTKTKSLAASPVKIADKEKIAKKLSKILGKPKKTLLKKISGQTEFSWLHRHLSSEQLKALENSDLALDDGSLAEGLWLVKGTKRFYPFGEVAAQVIGTVNIDGDGLEGVELWKNQHLQGEILSVKAYRDALGRPTFMDAVKAGLLTDGKSIQLTIDAPLQFSAEKKLKEAIRKTKASSGSVLVMNAVTGEILVMANYPSFNPNKKATSQAKRRNRAVTDGFEPGSTMKAILLASALENQWKLKDRVWGGKGRLVIQGKTISEAEEDEKFEWLTLSEMLQKSSNVAAANLALKLGKEKYLETLRKFGFGSKTGLGFPGEISGWIPKEESVRPINLATMGFGHGVFVTPIQMLRAYASFINEGWLIEPTLIKTAQERKPPTRIMSRQTAHSILESLKAVTTEGTGQSARLKGYQVGGKTGTAQVINPETRTYSKTRFITSFIGYAVGVEPKLVIMTYLDGPQGRYYASETAVPLFREVLEAAASRFGLPSDSEKIYEPKTLAQKDYLAVSQAISRPTKSFQPGPWKMPLLIGLSPREVLRALSGKDLQVRFEGFGMVTAQSPQPDALLLDGDRVTVKFRNTYQF